MKRNRVKLAALISLVILNTNVYGIEDDKKKIIEEEYTASQNTVLNISNKFGNVTIKDWNEDRVSVKVTISVEARNESRANEIMDYIEINRYQSGNTISFETEISSRIESGGFGWFGGSGNHELEIDYDIFAPRYISLVLSNKYGDVFVNHLNGHADINVKYGNLLINNLTRGDEKPINQITLGYSDGEIENINWAKFDIKYSKLDINFGKAMILMSKYSKLYLDEASSLVAESKYDTYNIGTLSNFVTQAAYSNYKFDRVLKKIHIESRYTNAKVEYVPPGFEEILIESKYGGFRFGIDKNASYQINGEAEYSNIFYPKDMADVDRIDENTEMSVSGFIGGMKSTNSKVVIETKYGNVHLTD